MPLIDPRELVAAAQTQRRALIGGNVSAIEMARALIRAAQDTDRPILIQFNRAGLTQIGGVQIAAAAVRELARDTNARIGLHLDHADSLEELRTAMEAGFGSLMIDGSTLPDGDHIGLVREARGLTAWQRLPLEAELGHVAGIEAGVTIGDPAWTDPAAAERFVSATGVDWLAVAVGNVHGGSPDAAGLQRERLAQIQQRVDLPLVLHGASGLSSGDLAAAVELGVAKINIGTALHQAMARGMASSLRERPDDLRAALRAGEDAVVQSASASLTAAWAAESVG